ncbi:TPR-like protein [Fomitiporia mediterranea MF3/22]|uniref:TPR-like protein n=1 Tax=Fomitiporia mediterranea (strain MF3/22) TaxID=694068 RepID=UPI0004408E08|nr:TPR-like protein [Fomitiporia mediterranea MF3/22]EJD02851.1 TPR-like protein [Fomitiporia mediterranea MF3/22]
MALPMLVNGADCGPVNPLQGLAKRFDQDRGIQQDQFVAGRAGPSREVFRTAQQANPVLEQETARFFSGDGLKNGITSPVPAPNAFDVSLLHKSLPIVHTPPSHTPSPQIQAPDASHQAKGATWAVDFLQQARARSTDVVASGKVSPVSQVEVANRPVTMSPGPAGLGMQWAAPMRMMSGPQFIPQSVSSPSQLQSNVSAASWDKEFQSHQAALLSDLTLQQREPLTGDHQDPAQIRGDADDLARTAALIVETVQGEQNPKFKNSEFMRLMRGLRDGDIVVNGDDMVEKDEVRSENNIDVKGKGKERAMAHSGPAVVDPNTSSNYLQRNAAHVHGQALSQRPEDQKSAGPRNEDPNEAYFRQENEDYIDYWSGMASRAAQQREAASLSGQEAEWGALQDSWDSFEATTWGVKPTVHYQFQPHNPYLNVEGTQQTMHHVMHTQRSIYESVLELEAQVQRDPTNARAWYDLGVKQQENEREPKAILALSRSLELDPTHLPSWLALAISYTNEGDRIAADDTILEWVRRNPRYEVIVNDYFQRVERLNGGTLDSLNQMRKHDELIRCLMAMARSGNEIGDIDADVQIALAVLLNTSEEYLKAQDCFKAALAVRPDDWQLYNRVGATLANSGLSEDAFQYYYRALELNPAYIRARFNLGISCMNMRRYEEAAQFILDALIMQDSDGSVHAGDDKRGITSTALWDSLRTSCIHLQRMDLADLCERKDLDGMFICFYIVLELFDAEETYCFYRLSS